MDNLFRRRGIYWIVILISALLIAKVFISYENSIVIDENVRIQKQAERIKVNTLDIIRTLHSLDLGIRGYAIIPDDKLSDPYDSAWIRKESVFKNLEAALLAQEFDMSKFYKIRDSVNSYFEIARKMMDYLKVGDQVNFENIFKKDYGYRVWLDYKEFSTHIDDFENSILKKSNAEYESALKWNYMILVFLLILIIPTLLYTAYQTTRTFLVLDQLKESEQDNNRKLATQNETLERLVKERTEEIAAQNEEIMSQYEEISTHNETLSAQRDEITEQRNQLDIQNQGLREAQKIIENQNEIIKRINVSLSQDVEQRTESLMKTNKELLQNISQLEQFTYIVSHNLRAPVARILGLGSILDNAKTDDEAKQIVNLLVKTSQELDGVLNDLNLTIQIKKMVNERLQAVDLGTILHKIKNMLQLELVRSEAIILHENFKALQLNTISAYMESILYNLISNAIKYRDPDRKSVIELRSEYEGEYLKIQVQDNGLGIDLGKHGVNLFNLYKRFHFHIEGKGLGLYLVKTQINLLGSEIFVESKVNEGTLFTVLIKRNNIS